MINRSDDLPKEVGNTAFKYLDSGTTQACSQTVLLALQEKYFQNINEEMIKACSLMAGGSRVGSLCGALVGGLLAIGTEYGLPYGCLDDEEILLKSYPIAKEFYKNFKNIAGSWFCNDITGYNIDDPEQREEWIKNDGKKKCAILCGKIAEMTAKMLDQKKV